MNCTFSTSRTLNSVFGCALSVIALFVNQLLSSIMIEVRARLACLSGVKVSIRYAEFTSPRVIAS